MNYFTMFGSSRERGGQRERERESAMEMEAVR